MSAVLIGVLGGCSGRSNSEPEDHWGDGTTFTANLWLAASGDSGAAGSTNQAISFEQRSTFKATMRQGRAFATFGGGGTVPQPRATGTTVTIGVDDSTLAGLLPAVAYSSDPSLLPADEYPPRPEYSWTGADGTRFRYVQSNGSFGQPVSNTMYVNGVAITAETFTWNPSPSGVTLGTARYSFYDQASDATIRSQVIVDSIRTTILSQGPQAPEVGRIVSLLFGVRPLSASVFLTPEECVDAVDGTEAAFWVFVGAGAAFHTLPNPVTLTAYFAAYRNYRNKLDAMVRKCKAYM